MTKKDIVKEISGDTGFRRTTVLEIIESFMSAVKDSLIKDENVDLPGFGIFIVKRKAGKPARDIGRKKAVFVREHFAPAFKPSGSFSRRVKYKVKRPPNYQRNFC